MIVLVAGMYRSGSTFVFNIVRESLSGDVRTISSNTITTDDVEYSMKQHVIVKSHGADNALIDLVKLGQA